MVFIDGLVGLAILWRSIPAVVIPAGICGPRCAGEFSPLYKVSCVIPGFHITDMPRLPVRPSALDGIRQPCPTRRHTGAGKSRSAIRGQQIWIQEDATVHRRSIPNHQLRLVGKTRIECPEPLAAFLPWHADTLIVPEVCEAFPKCVPPRK